MKNGVGTPATRWQSSEECTVVNSQLLPAACFSRRIGGQSHDFRRASARIRKADCKPNYKNLLMRIRYRHIAPFPVIATNS